MKMMERNMSRTITAPAMIPATREITATDVNFLGPVTLTLNLDNKPVFLENNNQWALVFQIYRGADM